MPRTRRVRQYTLRPGESQVLAFGNGEGREVTVALSVRNEGQEVRIVKNDTRWEIDVPPGSSREVDGLVDQDGTPVVLRVVARLPGERATPPEPSPAGSDPDIAPIAPVFEDLTDVVANIAVDVEAGAAFDDRADGG